MSTYLRVVGGLAGLVLRDLVDGVLLALLALAKGLALLGDAHHLSLFDRVGWVGKEEGGDGMRR
jgi:hypothetical protein